MGQKKNIWMHYGNENGISFPFVYFLHYSCISAWYWNGKASHLSLKIEMGKHKVQLLQLKIKTPAQRMLSTLHNAFPCALYVPFWNAVAACCDQQVNFCCGWRVLRSPTVMEPDLRANESTAAYALLCSGQLFSICFSHYRCYFLLGLRGEILSFWQIKAPCLPVFLGYLDKVGGIKHLQ